MKTLWISAAVASAVGLGFAAASSAQAAQSQSKSIPKSWNWSLDKNGNRVPKGKVVKNPDGSSREEVRVGKCVTVKERTAAGEYRQSTQCNPS